MQYFVIVSCGSMPRDNRCMYMAHVCFYVCCIECRVCGNVCCVATAVNDSGFEPSSLGALERKIMFVCVRDVIDVVFSVCIVMRVAVGDRVWEASCRWCMFVYCVHPVAVFNAAFGMPCSLLKRVDARSDHGRGIL